MLGRAVMPTSGNVAADHCAIASNLSQLTYPSWDIGFNVNHSFRVCGGFFTLTPSAVYPAATAVYHRHRPAVDRVLI